MPVFTAAATSLLAGTALAGSVIATSVVAAGLAAGVGHLLGVFDGPEGPSYSDPGVDQRSRANTQNKLPCLYGNFMTRGIEMAQFVTEDRAQLWTVVALGEGPVTSIDRFFWDDIELTLDADGIVTGGVDRDGEAVDRLNGLVQVYTYLGGDSNFSGPLSAAFPEWTAEHRMNSVAYAVVRVTYSADNDVRSLNDMRFIGVAPNSNPADAVLDQLTNTRYGLGLPTTNIDSDSFTAAATYFAELIASQDASGTVQMLPRYQTNGALGTDANLRNRINTILQGCNASLRWSQGQYSIFINRAEVPVSYNVNEDNLIGSVEVTEQGMNNLINRLEIQFGRDENNNWQRNEVIIETPMENRLPNEPNRFRQIQLPLVATQVEAERVGYIILNESREQLLIRHRLDVTGMPLEAGDVITYTLPDYGFNNKEFRITRIRELDEEGGIQYEVEAIEYADDVYTERMHIEPGASPNTSLPSADVIQPVVDLTLGGRTEASQTPNFELIWTVPQNSLIRQFDIFVNSSQDVFSGVATMFQQSTLPPGGTDSFTNGASITQVVTGLPAGSYSVWVVGRNNAATSSESNTVLLNNWNPRITTVTGVEGIRHHDNLVTNDPGFPTGPDGTTTGWYDPVEGSPLTTNRPANPNPHWEARGFGDPVGGMNRVLDFDFSGTGGQTTTVRTPSNQIVEFDFSGTVGERQLTQPQQQEITEFTFTGQAAEVVGRTEIWEFDFTGSSDQFISGTPGTTEEFFIYLTGNSLTTTTEDLGNTVTDSNFRYDQVSGGDRFEFVRADPNLVSAPTNDPSEAVAIFISDNGFYNSVVTELGDGFPTALETRTVPDGQSFRFTFTGRGDSAGKSFTATLPSGGQYILSPSTGGFSQSQIVIGQQSSASTLEITDAVGGDFVAGEDYTITFVEVTDVTSATQVRLSIPTESIDQTYDLTSGLTTATDLRDDLLSMLQADTVITNEFTVTAGTANASTTGVTLGEPIVTLTANDTVDHTISVIFNNGGGDISGSRFGSHIEGVPTIPDSVPTEIRVSYDSGIIPNIQDIIFSGTDADGIAQSFAAVVNLNDDLIATQGLSSFVSNITSVSFPNEDLIDTVLDNDVFGEDLPTAGIISNRTAAGSGLPSSQSDVQSIGIGYTQILTEAQRNTFITYFDNNTDLFVSIRNGEDTYIYSVTGGGQSQFGITLIEVDYVGTFGPGTVTYDASVLPANVFIGTMEDLFTSQEIGVSGSVTVETVAQANFSQPVITITERGTSETFTATVSTTRDGIASIDGTRTSYSIFLDGTLVNSGVVTSNVNSSEAADQFSRIINNLSTHTATSSGSVVTATTVNNSGDDLLVLITQGINDTGSTSTNDLAVSREVTQTGSDIDVFTGTDAMISKRLGTTVVQTYNVSGMSIADIAILMGQEFSTDGRFQAQVTGTELLLTATFTGTADAPFLDVTPGVLPTGVAATLAAARDVQNTGERVTMTGETTQLTIEVDGTSRTVDLISGSSAVQAAQEAIGIINRFPEYTALLSTGSVARATSVLAGVTDDLNITVSRAGTGGTIAVDKSIIQEGANPTIDFTDAVWRYFIINRGTQSDGDTTDVDDSGTVSVRRGLIQDTEVWVGVTPMTGTSAEMSIDVFETGYTASARSSLMLFNFNCVGHYNLYNTTDGSTVSLNYIIQYSTDSGSTWSSVGMLGSVGITVGAPASVITASSGNSITLPGASTFIPEVSTTYQFRMLRFFQMTASDGTVTFIDPPTQANPRNYGFNVTLIEELVSP